MTKEEHAKLVALNMKRCIQIIEKMDWNHPYMAYDAELKAKMHEIRRDSVSLEKLMYS